MRARFGQRPVGALLFLARGRPGAEIGGGARLDGAEIADGGAGCAAVGYGGLGRGWEGLVGEVGVAAGHACDAGLVGLKVGVDAASNVNAGGAGWVFLTAGVQGA